MGEQAHVEVPFVDLGRLHRLIESELTAAFRHCLEESVFVGGDPVREFELSFARRCGREYAVSCNSGTDALVLALRALGVGPGHEVVVPALTFVATAEAVVLAGAEPVLADVDPTTLLLTPESSKQAITRRTKAVIPVHLYGHMVPVEHLEWWREKGLLVVEDAAQAHFARDGGTVVGSVGDAACFSFYPGKNLGALGDGGLVVFERDDDAELARRLRDHGSSEKFHHPIPGMCSRLDSIQAAMLSVKLRHVDEWTARRRSAAERYAARLGSLLVPWRPGDVHHLLVARVPDRDRVRRKLAERGIETSVHYPFALSQQPWLAQGSTCPAAESAASEVISLPMHSLIEDREIDIVCEALEEILTQVA
ncbi:MAG: glutamine--scyllo-inositol aminotransferase [Acidimicrobiales bacterium]|nr:MAG: glutamine--scyllo-inositol aminotransferase [Acidimicrobiales bacterium]